MTYRANIAVKRLAPQPDGIRHRTSEREYLASWRRGSAGDCSMGLIVEIKTFRSSENQKRKATLDNPEHGDGADSVRRDELCPARAGTRMRRTRGNQGQRHANKEEMAGLDADAEEQHRRWNMSGRQLSLAQHAGKTQAVHQPEDECHDPPVGVRGMMLSRPAAEANNLRRNKAILNPIANGNRAGPGTETKSRFIRASSRGLHVA